MSEPLDLPQLLELDRLLRYLGEGWQFEIDRFGKGELSVHNLNQEGFGLVAYKLPSEMWAESGREGVDAYFALAITSLLNHGPALLAAANALRLATCPACKSGEAATGNEASETCPDPYGIHAAKAALPKAT